MSPGRDERKNTLDLDIADAGFSAERCTELAVGAELAEKNRLRAILAADRDCASGRDACNRDNRLSVPPERLRSSSKNPSSRKSVFTKSQIFRSIDQVQCPHARRFGHWDIPGIGPDYKEHPSRGKDAEGQNDLSSQ